MTNSELEKIEDPIDVLIKRHPLVFRNSDNGIPWDLPSGWFTIVDNLCKEINDILKESYAKFPLTKDNSPFQVEQIKEKFGGLRFYFTVDTNDKDLGYVIQLLVDNAEDKTYEVCMVTGKPGKLCKKGSHFATFCEEVRIKNEYRELDNRQKKSN